MTYDGTFSGNILLVGQTRCRKTCFVQSLGRNKIFGSIDSVDWISKVELSEIRQSFSYASAESHYPNDVAEFDTVLDLLKDNKNDVNVENNKDFNELGGIGENGVFDRLIVMDDVSGLSENFVAF